jgi:hypothetical protein
MINVTWLPHLTTSKSVKCVTRLISFIRINKVLLQQNVKGGSHYFWLLVITNGQAA